MKYILRFSNAYKEHWYFLNHGDTFGPYHQFRLISNTTQDRAKAKRFDAHSDALAALKLANDPPGWEIDEVVE